MKAPDSSKPTRASTPMCVTSVRMYRAASLTLPSAQLVMPKTIASIQPK